jgi:hypothetical protein
MPRLRVLAGPSAIELADISHIVNTYKTHSIQSDRFEGVVSVHIKGFVGEDEKERSSTYFEEAGPERRGVTWSIQVKGRFLKEIGSDNVLFGNTFDRPLNLPWGSGAALKFMKYVICFFFELIREQVSCGYILTASHLVMSIPHWSTHSAQNDHGRCK